MDAAVTALAEQIRAAAAERTTLRVRAGGSKDFYGNAPRGVPLDPRALRGIVSYEPAELALAARAGTPLAEIESTLAAHGQMLSFEPPHFGPDATIGGTVACGLAGPRRAAAGFAYGGVRDFVLGAQLLDGRAQLLRFGGLVMKNVAGYDVARLLTGSLGALGVITEVSLKVVPRPAAEQTLRFAMEETTALTQLNRWGGQPLPVSASAWQAGLLYLRLSGSEAALSAAVRSLGGERLDPSAAQQLWLGIREQTHPFFAAGLPLWRLSVPSTAAPLGDSEAQLIEWGGALRWLRSARPAAELRAQARQLGGHATLFRAAGPEREVFTPLSGPLLAIHRRLRAQFDPDGLFDAGRLVHGL
jgi:glycolate dehydrogenase FAD-binding subunit